MKKWLIVLLTLLLMLSVGSAAEDAPPTYNRWDWKYTVLADGTAEITSYTGDLSNLIFPATIDGYRVTAIGEHILGDPNTSISSITLPEGIVSIGDAAFFRCHSLTSLTLPESLTSIGDSAFNCCCSLTSITLPEGLTSIGDYAFNGCYRLISITLPNSLVDIRANPFCGSTAKIIVSPDHPILEVVDGVLFNKVEKMLIHDPSAKSSSDASESYIVPQGTRVIGDGAFAGYSYMPGVVLPDGLVSIGDEAFGGCRGLKSIVFPDTLISIGTGAFYYCNLTNINLPDSLTSIGNDAFNSCYQLNSITLPDSLAEIGSKAFSGCSLTDIFVSPDNPHYATIDGVLFEKATKMLIYYPRGLSAESYTVPQGICAIGDYAFEDCRTLTSITLPEGLTSVGDYAFYDCTALTSLIFPDSVTSIGDYAFPNIKNNAFGNSKILIKITIPESVTSIGTQESSDAISVHAVPYSYAEEWAKANGYHCVYIPRSGLSYGDLVYRIQDDGSVIIVACSEDAVQVDIPAVIDGKPVTAIGDYVFYFCSKITSLTIPDSVVSIGSNNFARSTKMTSFDVSPNNPVYASIDGVLFDMVSKTLIRYPAACTAESYTVPQGIQAIGDQAFRRCTKLTSIVLPEGVTTIGGQAFRTCSKLTSITLPSTLTEIGDYALAQCGDLTQLVIPDGVTTIGAYAFYNNSDLTSISLPASVTTIGEAVFDGCKALTSITVTRGSYAAEWALANYFACAYVRPTGISCGDLTYRLQADGSVIIVACETDATQLEVPAAINGAPVTAIGECAFADCVTLTAVTLPDSLTAIADTAFEGCGRITFTVGRGSSAAQWCKDNRVRYTYPNANDWLSQ